MNRSCFASPARNSLRNVDNLRIRNSKVMAGSGASGKRNSNCPRPAYPGVDKAMACVSPLVEPIARPCNSFCHQNNVDRLLL